MEKIDFSKQILIKKICPANIKVQFNNDNTIASFTNEHGDTANISAFTIRRTTTQALITMVQTEMEQIQFAKYAVTSGLTLK